MNMMMPGPECPPSSSRWSELLRCWNDLQEFRQLIDEVVGDLGYLKKRGATDGKAIPPGEIGEVIGLAHPFDQTYSLPAQPTTVVANVPVGVLPPGVWEITGQCVLERTSTGGIHSADFILMTTAGDLTDMGISGANLSLDSFALTTITAFINSSQPTEVRCRVSNVRGVAGTTFRFEVWLVARRMR